MKKAVVGIHLSMIQLLTSNYGFHYTRNLIKTAAETLSRYCNDSACYLKRMKIDLLFIWLNVNYLKIDKYFIDKSLAVKPDKAIAGDIIPMVHKPGPFAIAEGVAYEEQKQYLLANGCDKIQGHLVGRPLGEAAAIELLKNLSNTNYACHVHDRLC